MANNRPINLLDLPPEILRLILQSSPDIDCLVALLSSCRELYYSSSSSYSKLISAVLSQTISVSLIPNAIQLLKAQIAVQGKRDERNSSKIKEFFRNKQIELSNFEWTVAYGIAAAKTHSSITRVADRIAAESLKQWESVAVTKNPESTQLSTLETEIIQRALYRFEIYCVLFPPILMFANTQEYYRGTKVFFDTLMMWDIERFVSIYEALWRLVAPGRCIFVLPIQVIN